SNAARLRYGGDGARALLICGGVRFAGPVVHPLLALLPDVLVLRHAQEGADEWLAATLAMMGAEARAPRLGSPVVMTRLADILVIQAIRIRLEHAADRQTGWLGALADPTIGPALALIHR